MAFGDTEYYKDSSKERERERKENQKIKKDIDDCKKLVKFLNKLIKGQDSYSLSKENIKRIERTYLIYILFR